MFQLKYDYDHLSKMDVLRKIRPLLENGSYMIYPDGKIGIAANRRGIPSEVPWVYVRPRPGCLCGLWNHVYFEHFGMIYSKCQECWKIVVRPRTLSELFRLHDFEVASDLHCKCGIEMRQTVCGNYGGYFYNRSLEEGRHNYEIVKKGVEEHVGKGIKVILKRACTEYEHKEGDSSKWEVSDEQHEMEQYLDSIFLQDGWDVVQPDHCKAHVMLRWIHFALDRGDMTYLEFTGGRPIYPPYVTYHQEEK